MVSPELLRRYAFFSRLEVLKSIAMLTDEEYWDKDEVVFEALAPATHLYFLVEGSVELHYIVIDGEIRKDFYVGHINPGEPFGISALIAPFLFTATAIADHPCRLLKIEADGLRRLCDDDSKTAAALMRQLAVTAMTRLHETRVQLVAARA